MEKIGNYVLLKLRSTAGDIESWQARDEMLDRPVVVRITTHSAAATARAAFEDEARAAVPAPLVLDWTSDGRAYAVFPEAPGPEATAVVPRALPRRVPAWAWIASASAVLLCAAILAVVLQPWKVHRPGVAIIPFDTRALPDADGWIPVGFWNELTNDMIQLPRLRNLDLGRLPDADYAAAPAVIAGRLAADFVVTGTIARARDGIVVSLAIADASGRVLLSQERRHDPAADPRTTARDLAEFVAGSIASVATNAGTWTFNPLTADSSAWEQYLQGHYAEAARIDPHFIMALRAIYVDAANAQHEDPAHYAVHKQETDAAYARYREELDRSSLPPIWKARLLAGDAHNNGRWQETYTEGMKVYRAEPTFFNIRYMMFDACVALGRFTEAWRMAQEDHQANPSGELAWENWAWMFIMQRRFDEAAKAAREGLALVPDSWNLHNALATAEMYAGRLDAAVVEVEALEKLDGGQERAYRASIAALRGDTASAARLLDEIATAVKSGEAAWDANGIGALLVLGRRDEALTILQGDGVSRQLSETSVTSPALDPLRGDPRFTALQKKWGVYTGTPPAYRKK